MSKQKYTPSADPDIAQFEADLLESVGQMQRGEHAAVHTPEAIKARRGRPVGSTQEVTKEPVKLRLDPDVLQALKATGKGWQTRVNDQLRASLTLAGIL